LQRFEFVPKTQLSPKDYKLLCTTLLVRSFSSFDFTRHDKTNQISKIVYSSLILSFICVQKEGLCSGNRYKGKGNGAGPA